MREKVYNMPASIINGQSLSNSLEINGRALVGIVMPPTWTAANLTFQISIDGLVYNNLYDTLGTEVTVIAAAAHHIVLVPTSFEGFRYLMVRSGTSGTPVVQLADRPIVFVAENIF